MKHPFIFHPFLFALFPTLFLLASSNGQARYIDTLIPVSASLLLALIIFLPTNIYFKNRLKASLLTSGLISLIFTYGHALSFMQTSPLPGNFFIRNRHLLPLWFILLISLVFMAAKARGDVLIKLTKLLNMVASALVIINMINVATFEIKQATRGSKVMKVHDDKVDPVKMDITAGQSLDLPDIYYLIFDRYGNQSVLKEFFDYDNSELINFLRDKGFHIVEDARSNYPRTAHSLASTLNMKYVNNLTNSMGEDSYDWRPLYKMLRDNKVTRFLKSNGYKLVHFGSWWEPTRHNSYYDLNINTGSFSLPEFSRVLFSTTIFFPFIDYKTHDKDHWRRVLYKFEKLAEIADSPRPTFVFAHMLIPHPPYVFDPDGSFLPKDVAQRRTREANYVNQLVFLNSKIKELVETLIAKSKTPPIIIIQADEGPFTKRFLKEKRTFDWETATDAEVREKIGILNAIYFPGVSNDVFHPGITPVNTFRILFNQYFKAQMALLPDESYMFKDGNHIYKFFNVTKRVDYK